MFLLVACAIFSSSFILSVWIGNWDLFLSFFFSSFLKVMFGYGVFFISLKIANNVSRFCFVDAFVHGNHLFKMIMHYFRSQKY